MANIINKDYFIRDISIPATRIEQQSSIELSIEKYEKEVLQMVLGYELYELFISNQTDDRFKKLIEGDVFTFNFRNKTITRKWAGLGNSELESPIAYYVYFKDQQIKATLTTSNSNVKPKNQSSTNASQYRKLVDSWNIFVERTGDLSDNPYRVYMLFDQFDIKSYRHVNGYPSLYNYLLANSSVYPEWEFLPSEKINIFGL